MRFKTHAEQIEQAALDEVMPLAHSSDARYVEGVLHGISIALAAIEKKEDEK